MWEYHQEDRLLCFREWCIHRQICRKVILDGREKYGIFSSVCARETRLRSKMLKMCSWQLQTFYFSVLFRNNIGCASWDRLLIEQWRSPFHDEDAPRERCRFEEPDLVFPRPPERPLEFFIPPFFPPPFFPAFLEKLTPFFPSAPTKGDPKTVQVLLLDFCEVAQERSALWLHWDTMSHKKIVDPWQPQKVFAWQVYPLVFCNF